MKLKWLIPLLATVAVVSLLFPGCRQPPTEEELPTEKALAFIDIYQSHGLGGYTSNLSGITVVTQKPSSPVPGIQLDGSINPAGDPGYPAQIAVEALDYSENFVVIAFYGWRESMGGGMEDFRIKNLRQVKNTIYVTAHFEEGPGYESVLASPFDIVKVGRNQLIQYGDLTFVLQDESGKEQARNIFTVTK